MRDLLLLAVQLIVTLAKLARPGGVRSVVAESLLLKHQLIISGRSRRRAPQLTTVDRFALGLITLLVRPRRVAKVATILKPARFIKWNRGAREGSEKSATPIKSRKLMLSRCCSSESSARRSKLGAISPSVRLVCPKASLAPAEPEARPTSARLIKERRESTKALNSGARAATC